MPRVIKAFQISELEAIVENFYIETCKNPDSTFAYKGGHYEKDLLAKLNIPIVGSCQRRRTSLRCHQLSTDPSPYKGTCFESDIRPYQLPQQSLILCKPW